MLKPHGFVSTTTLHLLLCNDIAVRSLQLNFVLTEPAEASYIDTVRKSEY
jgi:hypothetical protein